MTQAIAKYAAKKMLSKEMTKYKDKPAGGQYDPFYEEIPHPRKPGKFKKVKKQVPDYIPQKEGEILAKARKRAYKLDFCLFNFMGFRFGWSSVIAIIPAIGDVLDTALALRLVIMMMGIPGGLPFAKIAHMLFNIVIDFLVGLIPFVGDLADAAVKCNSKNVRVFETYLDSQFRPEELRKRDKELEKKGQEPPRPATVYEDFSDDEIEKLNAAINASQDDVRQPARSYSPGRRERIPDEEMGLPQKTERSGRNGRH